MTAVADFPGKPGSIHVPDGRSVLVEVGAEIGSARCGAAPEGYEVEGPVRVPREAVEAWTTNGEYAPDGRIGVRDESVRNGYQCRSW